jgi:hypothetical protein
MVSPCPLPLARRSRSNFCSITGLDIFCLLSNLTLLNASFGPISSFGCVLCIRFLAQLIFTFPANIRELHVSRNIGHYSLGP